MDFLEKISNRFLRTNSHLCIGLDPDPQKIPKPFGKTPDQIFHFLEEVIEATSEYALALKPNLAYFEALGLEGIRLFEKVLKTIPEDIPVIADAKRGDIGNTSKMYAKAFFENLNFDSITLSPYMGGDSVTEFLDYEDKYPIILALTSNKGAQDFQLPNNLFVDVIVKSKNWKNSDKIIYVVGATKSDFLKKIRDIIPDNFLLIPGVGAQGGDVDEVIKSCTTTENKKILINISRSIIYAGNNENFVIEAVKKVDEFNSSINFK